MYIALHEFLCSSSDSRQWHLGSLYVFGVPYLLAVTFDLNGGAAMDELKVFSIILTFNKFYVHVHVRCTVMYV